MKSALTDGLDKYKIDIEAKETTSLNTPQSSNEVKPEDGENKIDTNLNGEKVIEESEKIHEPIVLELN
jgi:hypothetical protein